MQKNHFYSATSCRFRSAMWSIFTPAIIVYSLLKVISPGSLAQGGVALPANTPWSTILYFSLTTLRRVGYGDIVAVAPAARMLAMLETSAGVLYIAITVARLVAAGQTGGQQMFSASLISCSTTRDAQ